MQYDLIRAACNTPMRGGGWGLPLLFESEPGAAKTSFMRQVARKLGFGNACEVLSPGERGEGAFGVVPVPAETEDGGLVLSYPRPTWTSKFLATGRGLVIVDELTSAPPAMHPALLGLLLDGLVGGFSLPKGVRRFGLCNPVELAAGGYDLPAPVANRLGHLKWKVPTVDEHRRYMLADDDDFLPREDDEEVEDPEVLDAAKEERRIAKLWRPAYAKAAGIEGAFLQRIPTHKNKCPPAGDPNASKAWPSDRTWEFATRAWASAMVHNLTPALTETLVGAFISHKIAGELFTFAEKQDLPDPAELLDGKVQFKHDSKRLDRTIAVIGSCTATVTPKTAEKRKARAGAFWTLLDDLTKSKNDLDVFVAPVEALITSDLHTCTEAGPMLEKLAPTLRDSGMLGKRGR